MAKETSQKIKLLKLMELLRQETDEQQQMAATAVCQKLIKLVFKEGILLECNDLSHIAKAQREAMKQGNVNPHRPGGDNIPRFIEDSFSLDNADKAWWIK